MGSFLTGSFICPLGTVSGLEAKGRYCCGCVWNWGGGDVRRWCVDWCCSALGLSWDVQMQHYVNAALLIQHWRGSKSSQCRQRSWLFMCVGLVLRLSPLGNMWYSAAWREVMRTGKWALSSCSAADRTQTYWRMGGGKAQSCGGSLGWPDLGTPAALSVALYRIQGEGGTTGKHREDHDQNFLTS